jgi:hypothetical protein
MNALAEGGMLEFINSQKPFNKKKKTVREALVK